MSIKNLFQIFSYQFIFASIFFILSCTAPQKDKLSPQTDFTQNYISKSKNAQAFVPQNPHDDFEYAPVLSNWQRDVTLYKDFEMYFSGTVVLMTPEMSEAYKKRVEKVQGVSAKLDLNIIPKDKDMLSVVIAMYTSSAKFIELEDSKIWNNALFYNNQWIRPSSLVYYRNKSSFVPYFPIGSSWSRMYVAQFHVPHFDEIQKTASGSKSPIVFSMHSGIARADYYWR